MEVGGEEQMRSERARIDLTYCIGMVCDGATMLYLDTSFGFCCQSAYPFCGTGACEGCVDGDDVSASDRPAVMFKLLNLAESPSR